VIFRQGYFDQSLLLVERPLVAAISFSYGENARRARLRADDPIFVVRIVPRTAFCYLGANGTGAWLYAARALPVLIFAG
jgi:hypothetical protein